MRRARLASPSLAILYLLCAVGGAVSGCGDDGDGDQPTCASDEECRAGERCTPAGLCQLGVECVTESECEADDRRTTCDLETLTCTPREGFGDECGPGRPCAFGEFCSGLLSRCLQSSSARDCTRRSQCPSNQICDREANKCIPDPGCFGDEFCEPGEFCDLVNRNCQSTTDLCISCALSACPNQLLCFNETQECLTLEEEPTCRLGETCDPLGRCVQCTSNEDCGPGTFCNTSLGQCESNIQCADDPSECPSTDNVQCIVCEKPEVCDRRTRRCAAPPEPCESDVDCPNDQLCDQALEPPVCVPRLPDCINDVFDEPRNDSVATGRLLPPADGPVYADLKLCPGDQDWYRIDVEAGTFLTVDARFRHDEGDLELQLVLEDGTTLVDQSRSTTDNERVELEVGTDLTLYARTFLGTQTVRPLDYRLVVGRDPGDLCEDDAAEPNDGPGAAPQLLFDQPLEGRLCPADPDWFALRSVPVGARVRVNLDFEDSLGNLELEVYRSNSPVPLRASRSTSDGETIEFDAPYGGDFFVRVVGEAADENVYALRASLFPNQGQLCLDDTFEPNDEPASFTSAGAILGVSQSLSICGGDEDWFAVDLGPFEVLEAEIGFDGTQDLDLALLAPGTTDQNASPVEISNGVGGREYLAHRALQSGQYLVRVYGSRATDTAEYTLDLKKSSLFGCQDDENDLFMLGNSLMDPVTLGFPPTRQGNATICVDDQDWYRIFVRGGFNNTLRLQYPTDIGVLEFELLDFAGEPIFSSVGQTLENLREVNITVPGTGIAIILVRVFSPLNGFAPYSLALDLVPQFSCEPDPEEPNDLAVLASTRTATTAPISLSDLTLCPNTRSPQDVGDEDFFVLTPPAAGSRIEATIDFPQGDLLLELLSPGGEVRACLNQGEDRCLSDGNGLQERVTFTATTTEPYVLRVSSVYSAPSVQTRPVEADTPYRLDVSYSSP